MTSQGLWLRLILSLAAAPAGAAETPPPFTLVDDHGNSISLPRQHQGVARFWSIIEDCGSYSPAI